MQTTNPKSIRQLCITGLLAGLPTAEIAGQLKELHPTSAAAAKSTKHIAWYRAGLVKAGKLPKRVPQVLVLGEQTPAQVEAVAAITKERGKQKQA